MFGTILLAVDPSPQAERAGALATKLATATGDEVVVVHVTEFMVTRGGGGTVDLLGDQDGIHTAERHVKELEAAGVSARLVLGRALAGNIAPVIVEAAEEHDAGLIVMGSRGRTDLTSLLLGSVAHKVLHLSDRPVLVAP
jgi:nucleotide-binding universal stress UspA family protein